MMTGNKLLHKSGFRSVWIILAVYLFLTFLLLCFGYAVHRPAVRQQEFPFSVTYEYNGETTVIEDCFYAEYAAAPKYIGDPPVSWSGYVLGRNRLESDFYTIDEQDGYVLSVNINLHPGYLMGDPFFADMICEPYGACYLSDEGGEKVVTDPDDLEASSFRIVSWDYPQPLSNSFSFGGFSLSSEGVFFTTALALAALLACVIAVKRVPEIVMGTFNTASAVLNVVITFLLLPVMLVASSVSEIIHKDTVWQQLVYWAPAITVLGVSASVALRRFGYIITGFFVQFIGPVLYALVILTENL